MATIRSKDGYRLKPGMYAYEPLRTYLNPEAHPISPTLVPVDGHPEPSRLFLNYKKAKAYCDTITELDRQGRISVAAVLSKK